MEKHLMLTSSLTAVVVSECAFQEERGQKAPTKCCTRRHRHTTQTGLSCSKPGISQWPAGSLSFMYPSLKISYKPQSLPLSPGPVFDFGSFWWPSLTGKTMDYPEQLVDCFPRKRQNKRWTVENPTDLEAVWYLRTTVYSVVSFFSFAIIACNQNN